MTDPSWLHETRRSYDDVAAVARRECGWSMRTATRFPSSSTAARQTRWQTC